MQCSKIDCVQYQRSIVQDFKNLNRKKWMSIGSIMWCNGKKENVTATLSILQFNHWYYYKRKTYRRGSNKVTLKSAVVKSKDNADKKERNVVKTKQKWMALKSYVGKTGWRWMIYTGRKKLKRKKRKKVKEKSYFRNQ